MPRASVRASATGKYTSSTKTVAPSTGAAAVVDDGDRHDACRLQHDPREGPRIRGTRRALQPEDSLAAPAFGCRQERQVEQPWLVIRKNEGAVRLRNHGIRV